MPAQVFNFERESTRMRDARRIEFLQDTVATRAGIKARCMLLRYPNGLTARMGRRSKKRSGGFSGSDWTPILAPFHWRLRTGPTTMDRLLFPLRGEVGREVETTELQAPLPVSGRGRERG